jgi:hypothetical protein
VNSRLGTAHKRAAQYPLQREMPSRGLSRGRWRGRLSHDLLPEPTRKMKQAPMYQLYASLAPRPAPALAAVVIPFLDEPETR